MKKLLSLTAAVLLAAVLLAGCSMPGAGSSEGAVQPITRGVISGNSYQSTFTGLSCTLPDGWTVSADDKLEQYMGLEPGTLVDEKDPTMYSVAALTSQGIYDFAATELTTGTTLAVCIEDGEIVSSDADLTVDEYYTMLRGTLESAGTVYYDDKTNITIGGNNYEVLPFNYTTDAGTSRYIYCARKVDNYIITIRLSSLVSLEVTEVQNLFA